MDIDSLCEEVNAILSKQGIDVTDGRTAPTVNPRNVRYYRTIGLIDPPSREGGRAVYTTDHVAEIVAIKRAQADGTSLDDLRRARELKDLFDGLSRRESETSSFDNAQAAWLSSFQLAAPRLATHAELHLRGATGAPTPPEPPDAGWVYRVGPYFLSGFGPSPTDDQVAAIRFLLSHTNEVGGNKDI